MRTGCARILALRALTTAAILTVVVVMRGRDCLFVAVHGDGRWWIISVEIGDATQRSTFWWEEIWDPQSPHGPPPSALRHPLRCSNHHQRVSVRRLLGMTSEARNTRMGRVANNRVRQWLLALAEQIVLFLTMCLLLLRARYVGMLRRTALPQLSARTWAAIRPKQFS